jgi:ABC-type proline/glycine betaine transport system ATPase subunit
MSHLIDFVKASSMKHTVDLNMNLTVMLKGAKGSGKATLARHVAQMSGFHLLEVSQKHNTDTCRLQIGNLAELRFSAVISSIAMSC